MDLDQHSQTAFETITGMISGFFALLPQIAISIVVFIILWLAAGIVSKIVQSIVTSRTRRGVGKAVSRIVYIALLFVAFLIAVAIVAPTVGAAQLLQVLGVGSVAIGFAFRDILQNFLAGLLILLRQPFTEGDWIVFDDYEGTVKEISTRSTWLKTFDGKDITIPNGQIFTNPVSVITKDPDARSQYDVGIGYGEDIEKAKKAALNAIKDIDGLLEDPAPDAGVSDLAASSINLRIRWWTKTSDMYRVKQEVLQRIKERFDKEGIEIPFPHRQVQLNSVGDGEDA